MSKFKVGDEVRIPGFASPRRVLEVWRGRKTRYLLGVPIFDLDSGPREGVYQVDKLVDEDKLEAVNE